jgi:hypothetical protein
MNIRFDPAKLQVVPIESVRPNSWNPKGKKTEDFEKVKEGIRLKGLRLPVIVRENEGFEIIDGEQRWTACSDLGFESIIVYNEGEMSEQEAREMTLWYQTQVPFDEIQLAGLISEMTTEFGDLEVPFSEKELEKYKQLAEFSWDNYDTGESGEMEPRPKPEVLMIRVTEEQHGIITMAIKKVQGDNDDCSEGRALELICAEYLSGASLEKTFEVSE